MGRYWEGGLFRGRDNRLCCLWYLTGLGCVVCGLVCSTSSGFSSGLLFSVGVSLTTGFHCARARARACVRACVAWRIWCSYFLLLNAIINPYYHSCVFMTDIYLTISLSTHNRDDTPQHCSYMFRSTTVSREPLLEPG